MIFCRIAAEIRLPEALKKIIISISIFWITDSIDLTNVNGKKVDMWQVN
jgi:hypothetical protein